MRAIRRTVALVAVGVLTLALPAAAQEVPDAPPPDSLTLVAPYPRVAVEAGSSATFDLSVTAPTPTAVDLALDGLPEGWTGTFRGGGFEVDGVTASAISPELSLDVAVPAETPEGSYEMTVTASGGGTEIELPLEVRVSALAGGEVTLSSDVPGLRVPAGEAATFSVELRNDTPSDLQFELSAAAPAGWDITAEPASEPQATTIEVAAGASETINVEATSPPRSEAAQYPISVQATAGETQVQTEMIVEIVGSYSLELTTADQRLSTEVSADGSSEVQLVLSNTGTAPIPGVEMTATPPNDWEVSFAEPIIAELPAGESVAVLATVTPSEQAIAGDYVITFSANSEQANSEVDIRTTVNPSALWGFVGIALIALTLAGLAWVFRRFGRR